MTSSRCFSLNGGSKTLLPWIWE